MRLIDADALKLSMMLIAPGETKKYCYPCREILKEIDDAPTIEERKTGKWIDYAEDGYVECPFCHSATNCDGNVDELHFCFSCGAKMEGEQP